MSSAPETAPAPCPVPVPASGSATTSTTTSEAAAAAAAAAAVEPSPQQQQQQDPQQQQEDEDWQVQRDALKKDGDSAFRLGQFAAAIRAYSEAVSLDPDHAVLLSNRSAAYLKNGQKSAALHDAQRCVQLGTLGLKGQSRLAAALQSLGRYRPALLEWEKILSKDPNYTAAVQGAQTCREALQEQQQQTNEKNNNETTTTATTTEQNPPDEEEEEDDLADFFDEVEEVEQTVVQQKLQEATATSHEIIKHKTNLGTVQEQIQRLLADNYQWRNLNPFYVLDLPHTATTEEIQRRYKALSLLLHPDKNQNQDETKVQLAYDEVLKAKAILIDDMDKANHTRQLIEEGRKQGEKDFKNSGNTTTASLEEFQTKAVQRIFAEIEYKRRQVLERQRELELRERQQQEEVVNKQKVDRQFDKQWRETNRVDKRVGDWRGFQKKKKPKI
jgi:tetratricopeptide (TPR) repeat protein